MTENPEESNGIAAISVLLFAVAGIIIVAQALGIDSSLGPRGAHITRLANGTVGYACAKPQKRWFGYGSYYTKIETYLKNEIDDPASLDMIKCADVQPYETKWATFCDFRMKNRAGAIQKYQVGFYFNEDGRVTGVDQANW